jgi:hypothetical protein
MKCPKCGKNATEQIDYGGTGAQISDVWVCLNCHKPRDDFYYFTEWQQNRIEELEAELSKIRQYLKDPNDRQYFEGGSLYEQIHNMVSKHDTDMEKLEAELAAALGWRGLMAETPDYEIPSHAEWLKMQGLLEEAAEIIKWVYASHNPPHPEIITKAKEWLKKVQK